MGRCAFLLAACVLLAGLPIGAQDEPVRAVTLQEAIELGLAYNLGLKSARLDALVARLDVDAADAAWDPTLTSEIGGGESQSPSRSQLAGADVVDVDNFTFVLGIAKPLRLGPSLGLTWRADRTFTNSSFSTINPAYDTALELSLTVPLLRGRGRHAQEATLRASRAGAEGARWALVEDATALVEEIHGAFWNVAYFKGRVRVLEKSLEVAREIEATERRKLEPDIGRATRLDVTKAEAETKRREAALIQGRRDAADAADDLRRLVLPFTGAPEDRVVLEAVGAPAAEAEVPALDALVASALGRRPDLARTDADLRRLEEEVVRARDALRLQLDLVAGVSWRGVGAELQDSAGDTLAGETPSASAAVNLTWTFGRRAARAALRRAELQLERARMDRRERVNGVVVDVRKAFRGLRAARQEIEATEGEVGAASEALEGERQRLARGSTTVLEVSRLEENLTNAELRLLLARKELQAARVGILRSAGMLLAYFGVALDEGLELARKEP